MNLNPQRWPVRIISALKFAAVLGFASIPATAFAADLPSRSAPPVFLQPEGGYDVTIGIGPNVMNQFPGSKSITVLPTFHLGYRKAGEPDPFYTPDDAFDIALYDTPYFRIGPAANYINRRGLSNGNGKFVGLHNIDGTFDVGGFAEFYPIPYHLRLRGELLQGVNGSRGLVGTIAADGIDKMGPFEFSLGPRIGFGNDRYASQYFSVSAAEAVANPFIAAPYNAHGGLTSVGGMATVRYDYSHDWSVLVFGGYNRLVSSVGSSPIPNVIGSLNEFQAGVTLNYTFAFKGFGILGY